MADRGLPDRGAAVVSAGQVRLMSAAVRVGPDRPDHGTARVEVIRDGDVVRAVEVVCSCGARIVLRCDYD
jgi:hypothetical protein